MMMTYAEYLLKKHKVEADWENVARVLATLDSVRDKDLIEQYVDDYHANLAMDPVLSHYYSALYEGEEVLYITAPGTTRPATEAEIIETIDILEGR